MTKQLSIQYQCLQECWSPAKVLTGWIHYQHCILAFLSLFIPTRTCAEGAGLNPSQTYLIIWILACRGRRCGSGGRVNALLIETWPVSSARRRTPNWPVNERVSVSEQVPSCQICSAGVWMDECRLGKCSCRWLEGHRYEQSQVNFHHNLSFCFKF